MGDVALAVVSNRENIEGADEVVYQKNPNDGFLAKIKGIRRSPFDKTIFLDTETTIVADISELFVLLNRFELAVSHAPKRIEEDIESIPRCFPSLNTGVLAFKRSKEVDDFLRGWENLYKQKKKGQNDQPSFRRKLYQSQINFYCLPPEYNYRYNSPNFAGYKIKIFHGRESEIKTPYLPSVSESDLISKLNKYEITRVHCLTTRGIKVKTIVPNFLKQFLIAIEKYSIVETIKRVYKRAFK